MESTLSSATTTLMTLSKTLKSTSTLHRNIYRPSGQLAFFQIRRLFISDVHRSTKLGCISLSSSRSWSPFQSRLHCVSSSAASFASGGGGIGGSGEGGGGSGGGGGPLEGGEPKENSVPGGAEDVSNLPSDVIILDVGGMTCGGCAASVKRILESQPQVSSASVNLTTETAVVWPVSEAKVAQDWQKILGDALAKHLTSCGFKANLRGQGATEGDIPS